ncbi:phage protein GP20 [Methylobacterium sp. 4-46]|uniref:major capsid protein n=1 Tax=unclassified Methylobacterium TaxID=2615210 RepID=UPI000152DF4C|nr:MULTISPECIES: major capsid protein [Methylobacterium]ACA18498.1 phage protein GP20 [Methylobacterium sp. 4-46]WFT77786.1 major capsid protein [Methylobacterium nodulans]
MLTMDVFRGDAFSAVSLTAAVDRMGYVPGFLGSIPGLMVDTPIRTTDVWIEERLNAPALIQTSPRGAPPAQKGGDRRKARSFRTVRLADSSRIYADELQNIRAYGSETELKQLQGEVARRQLKIKQDFDLTHEHMRLGVIQGLVVDADGSTITDWYDELGQSQDAPFAFQFGSGAEDGAFLEQCNKVNRQVLRRLQGVGGTNVIVHAVVDDNWWDAMTKLPEVRETYKYAMQALQLQNDFMKAFSSFKYGNIMWHNYRGTDDSSTVAVPDMTAKFFPVGAGIFQRALAPAEKFEFVNTLGQAEYSWMVPDLERDTYFDLEMYSYPLYVCTMPQALQRGVAA